MSYADFEKIVKENDVQYVDLRFTDPRGKLQHLSMVVAECDEEAMEEGFMFDGSSIAGWKGINGSDMVLKLDMSTAVMDPFSAQPQVIVFCTIYDPISGERYGRDPRSIAEKAEQYVKDAGFGDTVVFGPEPEFSSLTMCVSALR